MESLNLQDWTRIGAMNLETRKLLNYRRSVWRFMESEDFRRQKLIVPMNLRDSDSSAAACSVAARDSGAFVPVGKIGSDTRQYDCLVTPVRVFPLGRFAFSVWCVGRVGGGPKLVSKAPSARLGE